MKIKLFLIGIFLLFLIGCTDTNTMQEPNYAGLLNANLRCSERVGDLRKEIDMNEGGWDCLEYKNRTAFNSEWIENCCVTESITVTEASHREIEGDWDNLSVNVSVSVDRGDTAWYGSGTCFDPSWKEGDGSTFSINGKEVDVDKCKVTPQHIPTTEQFCVLKRLMGH